MSSKKLRRIIAGIILYAFILMKTDSNLQWGGEEIRFPVINNNQASSFQKDSPRSILYNNVHKSLFSFYLEIYLISSTIKVIKKSNLWVDIEIMWETCELA